MSNSLITRPKLHVTCSWKAPNESILKDVVTVTCKDEYVSSEDGLTAMVNPDTCVCLRSSLVEENGNSLNTHEPCFFTLQLESQALPAISHMVIVSEAKVIEVYGAFQEYLTTATAEFLCEIDDMTVYCAEVKLNTPSQECSVKFARTSKPSEMWLYGIQIIWEPCSGGSEAMGLDSSFNFVTVDERLKSCLAPISKRAERCKEFIKMYGSLGASQNSVNVLPLLALARTQETPPSCLPLSQESEIVKDKSKTFKDQQNLLENFYVQNAVPQNHKRFSNVINASFSKGDFEEHDCSTCMQSFRTVLDDSLQSMENRLLKAFDERLASLQQFQEKQIEHAVVRILKEISFSGTVQAVKLQEKNFQTEKDVVAQSYSKFNTPKEQKSAMVNSSDTQKEFSVLLNNDLRCADADPKEALSCSSRSPKLDGVNVFAHENSSSEHDLSHLDKNCNSLSNSSSVCPSDQSSYEMKSLKAPQVNERSKVSMLCSKVNDETRHGGGPLKDSDIEQVIMELLYGYQSSTGINSPETRLNNESALPSLQ